MRFALKSQERISYLRQKAADGFSNSGATLDSMLSNKFHLSSGNFPQPNDEQIVSASDTRTRFLAQRARNPSSGTLYSRNAAIPQSATLNQFHQPQILPSSSALNESPSHKVLFKDRYNILRES